MVNSGKQRIAQRLGAVLLALACILGLAPISSAHADTTARWTVMTWDISTLLGSGLTAAQAYGRMLNTLRNHAGAPVRDAFWRTETVGNHYIELRVSNGTDHFLTLYFRSSNLYLEGFTVRGSNYEFSDTPSSLITEFVNFYPSGNHLFERLGYSSTYGELDGQGNRANSHFTALDLYHYFSDMQGFPHPNQSADRLRLANIVAATSEAVRIGWIQRRIQTVVRYGYHIDENGGRQTQLGGFGLALENNWSRLSRLAFRTLDRPVPSTGYVTIYGYTYQNLSDILGQTQPRRVPSLEALLALGTSR
ncbi:ribosome-inactivating family protein [Streptosporangium sp. NPDC020145]|uniref:ribosome-inactivating family protein n=1 Tax=Streptosporangium sp. NPDC020145 TaxID=3154694 RepID=UPI00342FF638